MKIQKPYLNSLSSGYHGVMSADIFLVTVEDSSKENECSYQRQTALVIVKQNARCVLVRDLLEDRVFYSPLPSFHSLC